MRLSYMANPNLVQRCQRFLVMGLVLSLVPAGIFIFARTAGATPVRFGLGVRRAASGPMLAEAEARSSAPAHLTLWLDYTPWGVHVPIFVAQTNGYFRREGLDVSIRIPADVTDPLKLTR
jgi:ABC-type nitrate/sulfonate/bicarbonate transport system substrate-binding protein